MFEDMEKKIDFLVKESNVSRAVAQIALLHSRGSVSHAKDMLESETCKQIFGREAREYNL